MKEDRINILISKYLRKSCTPEEKEAVEQWRRENKSNQVHFDQLRQIEETLSKMDFIEDTNTDQEWDKLRITLPLSSELESGTIRSLNPNYKKYFSIAAALAALVLITWLFLPRFSNTTPGIAQEFTTAKGETKEYQLPDGTSVQLNADSYLAIVGDFSKKERRVRLQGEAYFEVAKNPEKPFLVETEGVFTQVLGTAFNLRAYPESEAIKLSVSEGKVAFKSSEDEGLLLLANNAASYDKPSRTFRTEVFQQAEAIAWLNGGLYFKDETLNNIFLELERKFDIKIDNQTNLGEEKYAAEFDHIESPKALMDLIAISFNLSYAQEDNVIIISNK